MADAIRPMLPPLHAGHSVPPVVRTGTWQAMGSADPLMLIARGLDTGARLTEAAGDIVSVPDVWAQVTVFRNAIELEGHPLHGRAVAEWRGLLGCFALAAYRVPDLATELVPLNPDTGGSWGQLVARLTPQCGLLGRRRVNEVALVRVGATLIALAQPLTLLAPSRSLPDLPDLPGRKLAPWMAERRFGDPLLAGDLSREERAVLLRFLEALCRSLDGAGDPTLLGLAQDYRAVAGRGEAVPAGTQFEQEPVTMPLPAGPAFDPFRTRERTAIRPGSPVSDCLLALRPDMAASHLKGVVLFDPALHEQMGRAAGSITVWGRYSLRMLQDRPEAVMLMKSEAQSAGYLVVDAAALFLTRLHRTDGVDGEAAFEQHPPGAHGHLLPLSPLLLALMRRSDLVQACSMSARGAGGATVNLRLTLANGSAVTLSRSYTGEAGSEPPLTLSVWPNFQADWWGLHLAYSGSNPRVQYVAGGFISPQGIGRVLAAATDAYSAVATARALLAGDVASLADTTWFRQGQQATTALHTLPGAAEAVLLQDRRAGTVEIAGLLLLPEPRTVAGSGGAALVGIDFGTTNTAAYLRIGGQAPQPLRILPRHILAYRTAPQGQEELDSELMPVDQIDIPFQTILRDRTLPGQSGQRRAFRDTLIYFAQKRAVALARLQDQATYRDLHANLKWGDDQDSRERVELFLTEVCVLALAELADRGIQPAGVRFAFSFPEAFRQQQLSSFQGAARNAVLRAMVMTGAPAGDAEPVFQSEAVATAQYFINKLQTPATEGLVTFDIGGQTTDIAVVQSQTLDVERLAWRGSFQLAGRHLLIDFLRENPSVITQLARGRSDLEELSRSLARIDAAAVENRTLGVELLVNSAAFKEAFETILPTLTGMREADRLRATALAGLAGLFDYVGRTVRHLAEQGRVQARTGSPISLCLGGRASLLFKTLLRAPEDQQAAVKFFTDAAGDAMPMARLVFSQAPKQEVAFGLVSDHSALAGRVASEPQLGEALSFAGSTVPAEALLSSLDIDRAWRVENPVEFRRFVDRLPELRIRPMLPQAALGQFAGLANAEMSKALRIAQQQRSPAGPDPDSSVLEPPFVILLRLFVRHLATDPGAVRA